MHDDVSRYIISPPGERHDCFRNAYLLWKNPHIAQAFIEKTQSGTFEIDTEWALRTLAAVSRNTTTEEINHLDLTKPVTLD